MGNRVGIGRGPGANRKEGACYSLARWVKGHTREREVRGNGPFMGPSGSSLTSLSLACPFPLLARLWHAPSFLLAPRPCPIPTLFPIGPVKVSALADWFLYLKSIPCARLTHRPDDGGSSDFWNDKLLPDYTALQPRSQKYMQQVINSRGNSHFAFWSCVWSWYQVTDYEVLCCPWLVHADWNPESYSRIIFQNVGFCKDQISKMILPERDFDSN
jgi:hypothetical protein